jgi:PAS domain S-box-containing protein
LDPPGRSRRLAPFAAVLAVGLALGPLPPAVRPVPYVLALCAGLLLTAAVAWLPWRRWPARVAAAPAFGALVVFGLLHHGAASPTSGYGPLVLVPLFWLALYHGPRLLVAGLVGAGLVLLAPFATNPAGWRLTVLWMCAGTMVTWTTHRLVLRSASARAATGRERDFTAAVLDSAGFLLVVLDAQGNIVRFNRRCEEMTGRSEADVRGRPFFEVSPPPADGGASTTPPAGDGGEPHAVSARPAAAGLPAGHENHWTFVDGRRHTIVWQNTALTDADGRVTHIIATGLDVTEQRQTERTLAHVLAAATDQAIVAAGRDGVVTVFNAGAERLLGYSGEEVVGWVSPLLWYEPNELAERAASLGVAPGPAIFQAADEIGPQQWTYVRKDGTHVPVELTTTEVRDDAGQVAGFLSVARDVTKERQGVEAMKAALARETVAAARLRELDRVRTDLVATVSHELRTPLTSILGNVELLADGDAGTLSGAQARLIAAVERNARRLLALIEDLLMLSRIESGSVKINARPVHVRAIVGGALEALHTTRASRGVDLEVDLPPEPLLVLGDQAQLERVLINLVDNGLKFTPPGGQVRVAVDCDDGFARLVVSDTGMGIPASEVDSVFEQFFRSTRSQERASQGTGLGLAITKSIVERHGGRIWADSGGDRPGTQVVCLLPRA